MRIAILALAILTAAGCGRNDGAGSASMSSTDASTESAAGTSAAAQPRHATLTPTQDNLANGSLEIVPEGGGVLITGSVAGLKPSMDHGFHIHEKGDCSSPDASSAGEHFNPTSQPHGNPVTPPHHAGDMTNLRADEQGNAVVDVRVEGVTLGDGGPNDVAGRAVIVHAQADDYMSQPSGNSGGRIACGVIM